VAVLKRLRERKQDHCIRMQAKGSDDLKKVNCSQQNQDADLQLQNVGLFGWHELES
jgi:hypothetical protein